MNKRAFTMQFHWIFILIAGAIILTFFFSLVQKQRVLSQEKLSITLATDIEAVFSGAIESKGTAQPLIVPKTGIAFDCSQACECNFIIGSKATEFRDKIIFAPSLISDQNAVAWAQEFKLPFRITNFLFITNPNIKYYLVYEPQNSNSQKLYKLVNKSLPPGLNIATLRGADKVRNIRHEGFQETKLVFLDIGVSEDFLESNINRKFRRDVVSAVQIDYDNQLVSFFEKEEKELEFTKQDSLFMGDSSIFAAMFASDRVMYECGLKDAFAKTALVGQIVLERAQLLQDEMQKANRTECVYNLQALSDIIQLSKELAATPQVYQKASLANNIARLQSVLERENKNIIQLSCPEIF